MATKRNKVQIDISARNRTRAAFNEINRSVATTTGAVRGLAGVFGTLAAAVSLREVVNVVTSFEKLNASLITVTGSAENAEQAMGQIQGLAATLPFSIQEVTDSFIRLKAYGLDPSEQALMAYANTASAMGKSLNQVIEAVADAATGEFERLKEFGIKAKSAGDNVIFTFRGISTEVRKSAREIEDYIQNIGLEDFAGAAALQVDTLGGALVNLGDSIAIAVNEFAKENGLIWAIKTTALGINDLLNEVRKANDPLQQLGEEIDGLIKRREELRAALSTEGDQDIWAGQYRQLQDVNYQLDEAQKKWLELIKLRDEGGKPPPIPPPPTLPERETKAVLTQEQRVLNILIDQELAQRKINDEILAGVRLSDEATQELEKQARLRNQAIEKQNEAEQAIRDSLASQKAFADDVAATMTSAFEDAIFQANSLSDIFKGLLEDLARMVVRMAILRPLSNTISDFIPQYAGGTNYHPGGLAIVGEQGPELVSLPRGSSVTPNNRMGGVSVVVNNNTGVAADAEVEQQPDGTIMVSLIESVVADSINNNGGIGKAMVGSFGTRRRAITR